MGKKAEKTNVMRILDRSKIAYNSYDYSFTAALSGTEVADALGKDPACTFKTLVTQGASKAYYVFMVPVADELDLKKAARAAGEKSIAMIKSKELLPLTGYVHGGCSPIGMKKQFKTFIHLTAAEFDLILFSAGKIGYQVEMPLSELQKIVTVTSADITVS
ncbi:MAG: Cys-tRNA(Pro) deacylase [Ruminococcus sp.]|nr:Cys-tRNA(Pro) deacylase [Ruminococcus sp.]